MAARKGKVDKRNILIVFLSLVICVQTYLLYRSDPEKFTSFFVRSDRKSDAQARAVKKPAGILSVQKPKSAPVVEADTEELMVPLLPSKAGAKVAIIIDDWGYTTKNCQYLRDIKSPITVAILPNLPHSGDVAQCAHDAGKEVMLHLPMEPHKNSDQYPEDYIIKTTMTPIKVDRLLSNILDKMQYVDGVNNHMGSKATEDKRLMTTIFKQLRHRHLFYVDSRVTAKSVCAPLAKEMGVPFASRDVFLDNVNERAAIAAQLTTLARIAKKRGWAIAIGHDRSLTMQVIQERIGWFKSQGIEFVTVKEIIGQ